MKIVITGATGFLGGRLLGRLSQEGPADAELVGVGRTLKPGNIIEHDRVRYELGDLEDASFVSDILRGADKVVHAAALSAQMGPPGAFERANVTVTRNVVDACVEHGIERLVLISSPSVYFQLKDLPNLQESDPLPAPINVYARTKREAEQVVQGSGLPYVILRPRALIGRGDTVILPRVIRAHQEGRLRRMGTEQNKVDLTPVSNVVDAILLSLNAKGNALNQVYNISNGEPIPLWPLLDDVFDRLGFEPVNKHISMHVAKCVARALEWHAKWLNGYKEPALTVYGIGTLTKTFAMDISKARNLLGYEPHQSVQEALQEFLNWYTPRSHDPS